MPEHPAAAELLPYIPTLTLRQPWAWAVLHGKPVENRTWRMPYQGPLWLHAGARSRWDAAGADNFLVQGAWLREITLAHDRPHACASDIGLHRGTTLMTFSAVVALVQVTGCHHASDCYDRGGNWCSPWSVPGQYHIELTKVRALPQPVTCNGQRRLWALPPEVETAARAQLAPAT